MMQFPDAVINALSLGRQATVPFLDDDEESVSRQRKELIEAGAHVPIYAQVDDYLHALKLYGGQSPDHILVAAVVDNYLPAYPRLNEGGVIIQTEGGRTAGSRVIQHKILPLISRGLVPGVPIILLSGQPIDWRLLHDSFSDNSNTFVCRKFVDSSDDPEYDSSLKDFTDVVGAIGERIADVPVRLNSAQSYSLDRAKSTSKRISEVLGYSSDDVPRMLGLSLSRLDLEEVFNRKAELPSRDWIERLVLLSQISVYVFNTVSRDPAVSRKWLEATTVDSAGGRSASDVILSGSVGDLLRLALSLKLS